MSEGDLVRRRHIKRDDRVARWLQMLAEGEDLTPEPLAYIRSGDRLARDLMTREVVTVEQEAPLPEVARLLEEHGIKRVPVLRQGRVVGIVSRADLCPLLDTRGGDGGAAAAAEHSVRDIASRSRPPLTSSERFNGRQPGAAGFHRVGVRDA